MSVTRLADIFDAVKNKPKLTDHETVKEIAKKLGATEAQVLVAWGVYRGYSVIPKSVQTGMFVVWNRTFILKYPWQNVFTPISSRLSLARKTTMHLVRLANLLIHGKLSSIVTQDYRLMEMLDSTYHTTILRNGT